DYPAFARAVRQSSGRDIDSEHIGKLWLEALSLRAADAIQTASFTLPATLEPSAPPEQAAVVEDDGSQTRVTLHGGRSLHRIGMLAALDVTSEQAAQDAPLRIYATRQSHMSIDHQDVTFIFPSLAAAGIKLTPGPVNRQRVSLKI